MSGVDEFGGMAVLVGQPVVGQMQVDTGRFDGNVAGLGLDRLERHARFSQPGETGMAKLVAGGPSARLARAARMITSMPSASDPAAARPFQGHEDPIGRSIARSLRPQIVTDRAKKAFEMG